jgi:hypothetical protein
MQTKGALLAAFSELFISLADGRAAGLEIEVARLSARVDAILAARRVWL